MAFLDMFRRKDKSDDGGGDARMKYGSRGEEITYRRSEKTIEIGFSWSAGARLETDGIEKWRGGSSLTDAEKTQVFNDVLTFVKMTRGKPVVVINRDDPSQALWSNLCAKRQSDIARLEYTSDDEGLQLQRADWLETVRAGKQLIIDGVRVETEADVSRALERLKRKR